MTWIPAVISLIGSGISNFFGLKEKQQETISKAVDALREVNNSDTESHKAAAQVIMAEANSESWITRTWRPLLMVIFGGIVVAYFFGFTTPNLMQSIPSGSLIGELFEIIKIGLVGYIPARSIEKIIISISKNNKILEILKMLGK